MNTISEKSEILFLYESTFSMPNGDPFTGEQRYDDETKKVLVSDVRIKRFIRDYWSHNGQTVYVMNPDPENKLTAGLRFKQLFDARTDKNQTTRDFVKTMIDVRIFGAVVPIQKDKKGGSDDDASAFNLTGAAQFALLNPSLNQVDLRMHQNTSHFVSKAGDKQGTIGTTSVVPYALCQIHGWINPYTAKLSGMTESDADEMFTALWKSINNANTRSKSNQNSVLLLQVIYQNPDDKLYGLDRLIKIKNKEGKRDEQLRNSDDYEVDFQAFLEKVNSPKIKTVRFFTEVQNIENALNNKPKFEKFNF